MTKKDAQISFRIPLPLKALVEKCVSLDTHLNGSDFIRDAIREKIQREAPDLYRELFRRMKTEAEGP